MRIYIAAPYEMKQECAVMAIYFRSIGFVVTSQWHDANDAETNETAEKDLADIDAAEVFVLANPADWKRKGTGGRHVEFGYALAKGKKLVIVGARTNLFHQLDSVRVLSHFVSL